MVYWVSRWLLCALGTEEERWQLWWLTILWTEAAPARNHLPLNITFSYAKIYHLSSSPPQNYLLFPQNFPCQVMVLPCTQSFRPKAEMSSLIFYCSHFHSQPVSKFSIQNTYRIWPLLPTCTASTSGPFLDFPKFSYRSPSFQLLCYYPFSIQQPEWPLWNIHPPTASRYA